MILKNNPHRFQRPAIIGLSGLGILLIAFIAVLSSSGAPEIQLTQVLLKSENGRVEPIVLPFSRPSLASEKKFELSAKISAQKTYPDWIRIIADDCNTAIGINGETIPLTNYRRDDPCDWQNGIDFPIGRYLKSTENSLSLNFEDFGGNLAFRTEKSRRYQSLQKSLVIFGMMVLFLWCYLSVKTILESPFFARLTERVSLSQTRAVSIGLILVTGISFFTHFRHYDDPQAVFWDENYHIPSAQKYLNGVFFQELHPPLGKLLIALGEKILHSKGKNEKQDQFINQDYVKDFPPGFSFIGYRFFPALFSWLTTPIVYLIFLSLISNPVWATLLSGLYCFDNALIVHGRGAMIEGLLLFLEALMILQFSRLMNSRTEPKPRLRGRAILFGLTFGLVMTTKLVGLIMILLIPAVLFHLRRSLKQPIQSCMTFLGYFLAGSALTYVLVWQIHFSIGKKINPNLENGGYYQASEYTKSLLREGRSSLLHFTSFWQDAQAFIRHYDKGVPELDFTKPKENGSPAYAWPFGARSISYRWDRIAPGLYRHLYLQANPAVWFTALIGLILATSIVLVNLFFPLRNRLPHFNLILVFLGLYYGYMVSIGSLRRVMYLYHYFTPLLLTFILFGLIFSDLNRLGPIKFNRSSKTSFLTALALIWIITFWIYSPLTYYSPIRDEALKQRSLFSFWNLKCSECKNP